MNTPSHPWKQALARNAATLQAFTEPHPLAGPAAVKLEEAVILGCYTIRRLISGSLLPEARTHQLFPMTAFPARRLATPTLGDEPLATRYDLGAGHSVQHNLMFLCHQALQNCVFEPWIGPDRRLVGIHVTSDHQRKIALYGITLGALVDLFLRISED